MSARLENFKRMKIDAGGATINTLVAGKGEPLLMLHGYPQTHMMWHKVAPALAEKYTVVLTDLRGYGDSSCPESGPDHFGYSKRAMGADQMQVMKHLGFDSFYLVGHDRGARVCHQMLLDNPGKIRRSVLLDIIPTTDMYERADAAWGSIYYHWFFFIQKYDLPESLIGANPGKMLRAILQKLGNSADVFPPDVMEHYIEKFSNPDVIHATCEDYRAGATLDMEHIRAATAKIAAPLLVLWGSPGLRRYDVVDIWRKHGEKVSGFLIDEAGHFIAEETPEVTIKAIDKFFSMADEIMTKEEWEGA